VGALEKRGNNLMCHIYNDGDVCQVWRETEVRARKAHKCNACHRTIAAGETYLKHFSVYDGDCTDEKACKECKESREAFLAEPDHEVIFSPSFHEEELQSCIGYGADDVENKKWIDALRALRERRAGASV
jgi:hypothetical protein